MRLPFHSTITLLILTLFPGTNLNLSAEDRFVIHQGNQELLLVLRDLRLQ